MSERSDHVHKWRRTVHMDLCHAYSSTYGCSCGATASTTTERDPVADPYSMVWMDDEGQDRCERCDEIKAGAPVTHHVVVTAKDGTVERDETTERPQGEEHAA